jgi:molybdopterin-guanine dinucleotide biosynthesis protein A
MYDERVNSVTAFVLAGGKSMRMGADKALLEIGGVPLLSHALKLAGSVTSEVRIVGSTEKFAAFGLVVEDVYRDRGPLGGIHAALSSAATDISLMLAVDMPFVRQVFLEYLILRARESSATVTVPRSYGGFQPLCAVYRREFGAVAETALRSGKNKIDSLFGEVSIRIIEEDELRRAAFRSEMFRNLNTAEEWDKAKSDLSFIKNGD